MDKNNTSLNRISTKADKTILVVDDSMVNQALLKRILTDDGFAVLQAMNGQEALGILDRGTPSVSLIILDIIMPVMDGFELLDIMNKNGMIHKIPVIVMTGNDEQLTETRCLNAGVSDFISKSSNPALVLQRAGNILSLMDHAKLASHLETDSLTELYSRDFFFLHADIVLDESPDSEFYMVYLNVVDFKILNAHYGSEECDRLLRFIGENLRSCVSENGICGRIGSDIFAVLIKKTDASKEMFNHFFSRQRKNAPIKNAILKCGIYPVKDRSISVTAMSDYAKIAEESIKSRYGVYYKVYDDSMSKLAMREHQLSNYMEEALEKEQFLVYLQPKHAAQTGDIAGAEALVRWVHPELGFIPPNEFISLFERNGFIAKMDHYVWERVCIVLRGWIDAGIDPVPISVNASRADFFEDDLAEKFDGLIEKYQIPPELLHIEVTESAYTDHPQQIISTISTLRDMGFKIEMDDFGSGYSSLNMLSELPIDMLKLDMRFMQRGNEQLKGSKRNILSFIVSLSKWLQLPTIAEGVETDEEVESLKSMGCNYIQGYFYSKPLPISEFEKYFMKHKKTSTPDIIDSGALAYSEPSDHTGSKPHILVVEDIESNRQVIKSLLAGEYAIATAENGAVAYEYIEKHHDELSCILLDLLMPVMDGFQLLEKLHREKLYSDIPIIITTETGSNGELRALNLGAHSFVAKPYNPDVLRHHIRKAVEEREFIKFKQEYLKKIAAEAEK